MNIKEFDELIWDFIQENTIVENYGPDEWYVEKDDYKGNYKKSLRKLYNNITRVDNWRKLIENG